jgi:hypothetical protein
MAQIVEKTITVRLSKLVKNADSQADIDTSSLADSLEVVVSELIADPSIIVEITND